MFAIKKRNALARAVVFLRRGMKLMFIVFDCLSAAVAFSKVPAWLALMRADCPRHRKIGRALNRLVNVALQSESLEIS
jgi:hypothetical protein